MITDELLDQIIDEISAQEPDPESFYASLSARYPSVTHYLADEDTRILMDEEHDYLLFLGMVVVKTLSAAGLLTDDLAVPDIESHEEQLWASINAQGSRPLEKIWDDIGEDEVMEDFILDSISDDEDSEFLTEQGAQLIYVKLAVLVRSCTPG